MTAGHPKFSSQQHKHPFFIGGFLIVFAFVTDAVVDSITEGEDLFAQFLSPPRLFLLFFLLVCSFFLFRMIARQNLLKKTYDLHRAAMESSIDGIAIFNADHRLVYSNTAHTRLYGCDDAGELTGKSWRDFYSEDQLGRFYEEVSPTLLEKGEWRGTTIGTRKDGSRFPQDVSLTSLENGGMIRIVRDVTEKKRYQQELERRAQELTATNSDLRTFSYSLSHDMRGHIARISSAAQILDDMYAQALDENGKFLVHSINNSAEEMEELIESIEVLSSISRSSILIEEVDLSGMVSAIVAEMKLGEPTREVDFVIAPDVSANCDAKLARVALDNLLGNAWKYTGLTSSARIEFGTEEADGRQLLFIKDNGLGFHMEDAAKLFEPFQRLPNAKSFPGTGIGLATVRRVIQMHNGELLGFGEPGKGATFYFS
ncbi:sensor histidine kinase, partial [Geomonas sp.]|uniref:sensor histidine kinase n=1 Tax=Geomonas sp. TaxID=2651584 RepID=UPI002B46B4EB